MAKVFCWCDIAWPSRLSSRWSRHRWGLPWCCWSGTWPGQVDLVEMKSNLEPTSFRHILTLEVLFAGWSRTNPAGRRGRTLWSLCPSSRTPGSKPYRVGIINKPPIGLLSLCLTPTPTLAYVQQTYQYYENIIFNETLKLYSRLNPNSNLSVTQPQP